LILFLNILAVLLLSASYLAYYTDPKTTTVFALAGLGYPYILLLNIIFALFWLFSRIRFAFISIVFILVGWNHITRVVQFGSQELPEESDKIKILSYNVQNFVKENVSSTKYITDQKIKNEIFSFIENQQADIICIQEFLYDGSDYKFHGQKFGEMFGCPNFYMKNYYESIRDKLESVATFTKYPIVNKGHLDYEEKIIAIYTDLKVDQDTIRLYNLHLASMHFKKEDYDFINEITDQQNQKDFKKSTLNIVSKISKAYIKRSHQVRILESHLAGCPYPVIVCGDFNDTPLSYAYRKISKGLTDAFTESGTGFGTTFNEETFPAIRIDYIFHSDHFKSGNFERQKIPFSDHYPISCDLSFR
jgi:endonuclease/exonuclease/phosphatase family metal-dependent hydrolase